MRSTAGCWRLCTIPSAAVSATVLAEAATTLVTGWWLVLLFTEGNDFFFGGGEEGREGEPHMNAINVCLCELTGVTPDASHRAFAISSG